MKTNYKKMANSFAEKHGVKLSVIGEPEYRHYFQDDREPRYVFKLRLSRNGKSFTFTFGQSIMAGDEKPDLYTVLDCLTIFDPGSFSEFCGNFGYSEDSKSAERIYKSVCREYKAVCRLFPEDEIIEEIFEMR